MTYTLDLQFKLHAQSRAYPAPPALADIDSKGLIAHEIPEVIETWEQADELLGIVEDEIERLNTAVRNSIRGAVRASIGPRPVPLAGTWEGTGIVRTQPTLAAASDDADADPGDSPSEQPASSHAAADEEPPGGVDEPATWPQAPPVPEAHRIEGESSGPPF